MYSHYIKKNIYLSVVIQCMSMIKKKKIMVFTQGKTLYSNSVIIEIPIMYDHSQELKGYF